MTADPIGVVVVNYASADLIHSILGAVELVEARVVVVDNFSTATERGKVAALASDRGWSLVPMSENRGFGPGVNAGVARARELGCRCFLLLNPDAVASAAVVETLRLASLAEPMALISPRLVDLSGKVVFAGSVLDLRDGRIRSAAVASSRVDPQAEPMPWLTAACLAVHEELWERVGGFDESYFMYWEDVDFNYRCQAAGATLILRDDLTVVHDQGGTQGPRRGRAKSALYYFYNARNRMVFAARHLDGASLRRWFWRTPAVSWEILMRGGRRQLVASPRVALSAGAGALSGMRLGLRALGRGH